MRKNTRPSGHKKAMLNKMASRIALAKRVVGTKILPVLFLLFFLVCMYVNLTANLLLLTVLSILNLCLFLSCLSLSKGITKIVGYLLFFSGVFLLAFSHGQINDWLVAFRKNSSLITMVTMVPLLGIPLKMGGYLEALAVVYKKHIRSELGLYVLAFFYSHLFCLILLIGSVPIVYQLLSGYESARHRKVLALAVVRGFSSATLWSANFPAVALVLQFTGVSWLKILPLSLILGFLLFLLSYLWEKVTGGRKNKGGCCGEGQNLVAAAKVEAVAGPAGQTHGVSFKIVTLAAVWLAFLGCLYLLEWRGHLGVLVIVPYVVLVFAVVWGLFVSRSCSALAAGFLDYAKGLSKFKNEVIVFAGAGFFASAVVSSGLTAKLTVFIQHVSGSNTLLLTYFLVFLVGGLSILGIHPLVVVTTLAASLDPGQFNVTPFFLAVVLICSFSMSLLVSPYGANLVMMTAGLFNFSPIHLGIKWNGVFTVLTTAILGLLINLFVR